MDIRHLQSFVIAAESESFTRAGEVLGVSQAAVSQHVAAMERELRIGLFKRGPRSVSLTESGRRVYDYARRILDLIEEMSETTGQQDASIVTGTLRIACSTVPSEWLLPKLMVKFREQYPEVHELVTVSDSAAAIHAVESGTAEVGLVGELPRAANLCAKSIAQDELMLVVGANHPFAKLNCVKPGDIVGQPLIVREADSGSRRCIERALAKAGLSTSVLNFTMEVNSNDAIRAAVEHGVGISFLSIHANARDIQDRRLISVKIDGVNAVRDLYLVSDPKRLPTRVVRIFLEFIEVWRRTSGALPRAQKD
jgi:DNA-binding transcriptional LysR family regulator